MTSRQDSADTFCTYFVYSPGPKKIVKNNTFRTNFEKIFSTVVIQCIKIILAKFQRDQRTWHFSSQSRFKCPLRPNFRIRKYSGKVRKIYLNATFTQTKRMRKIAISCCAGGGGTPIHRRTGMIVVSFSGKNQGSCMF